MIRELLASIHDDHPNFSTDELFDFIDENYVIANKNHFVGDLGGDHITPELMWLDGCLVLCVNGKAIAGQRTLRVNSEVNEVVNIDVNIVANKKIIPVMQSVKFKYFKDLLKSTIGKLSDE